MVQMRGGICLCAHMCVHTCLCLCTLMIKMKLEAIVGRTVVCFCIPEVKHSGWKAGLLRTCGAAFEPELRPL